MIGKTAITLLRSRLVWLAVGALWFACTVFVGVLASAWWDPPSRIQNVKVALVSEDRGFVMPAGPAAGQRMHLGADVAKNLTSVRVSGKTLFDWQRLSSKAAALNGLRHGDYVLAVVVPADFSERLATLGDPTSGTARPAAIDLIANQASGVIEVNLVTSVAQQLVQKASTQASVGLIGNLLTASGKGGTQSGGQAGAPSAQAAANPRALAIGQPIQGTVTAVNSFGHYGQAIGLMFFMLVTAIGALGLTVVSYRALPSGTLRKSRYPATEVLGRWLGMVGPAIVLACAEVATLEAFGFSMASVSLTYGIVILATIALLSLCLALRSVFGIPGLATAGFLIPIQVAAGGSFVGPEMTPGFYRTLAPVLPWTHALKGLRLAMFGGSGVGPSAANLLIISAACLALGVGLCFVPGLFRRRSEPARLEV
jgi:YhgE/Pip-like protein